MERIGKHLNAALADMEPSDGSQKSKEALLKEIRTTKVKKAWEKVAEEIIIYHTNAVYLIDEDGQKVFHVYVDESIFAAELNHSREMLVYLINKELDERVDRLEIHISYGLMRKRHLVSPEEGEKRVTPIPLNSEETAMVERACSNIEDFAVREAFKKAMIFDLEWKKGVFQQKPHA